MKSQKTHWYDKERFNHGFGLVVWLIPGIVVMILMIMPVLFPSCFADPIDDADDAELLSAVITETSDENVVVCDVIYSTRLRSSDDNLIDLISRADHIQISDTGSLIIEKDLPTDRNYSYFQSYMSYKTITDRTSPAYEITRVGTYVDADGLLRKPAVGFTISDQDDYVIALGSYYTDYAITGDGTGIRYLVITTTGAYTAITGDEKDDDDTDPMHMYTPCGEHAGLIEWIVDPSKLDAKVLKTGTLTNGPNPIIQGEIQKIYRIYED